MAAEDPDAEELLEKTQRAEDDERPAWAGIYFDAFEDLRDDRQFGAFGGATRISFVAIERWAASRGMSMSQFTMFVALIRAMDDEYLDWLRAEEEARKAAEENK